MSMIKEKAKKQTSDEATVIHWGGDDPFTHTLCIGPTRCGKTATVLKPIIWQLLLAKKRGINCGFSVVEPKGDVARMVKEMAEEMGLGDDLVYIDPLYPDETNKLNVMKGDKNDVAEATVAVLKSLFGKQDAFFASVQELSSRKVTLLLKELYADNMDIMDVLANLRDESLLKNNVEKLRQAQGTNDLVQFFDNELLGSGNMAEKYRQFIVGLRSQLENITSNEHLKAIVTGKSDIDLDEHFEKGGILAVNSALGKLGKAGDAFGMFIAMHLQLATFRRKGTERTRVPHYLIIDEYSRYINPDVERFLSIAAEYRVALIAAIQSLAQLELESGNLSGKAMKRAILTSTRNKIVFGGLEYEDAEEVSKIMGKNNVKERSRTFGGGILDNILPKHYKEEEKEKERYYPTFIMDGLPRFHYIHKLLKDGSPQEPGIAVGDFIPRDWKEQLEAEEKKIKNDKKPIFFKWRERAQYEVNRTRLKEREEIREKAKVILAVNPFEDENEPENIVLPTIPTISKEKTETSLPIEAAAAVEVKTNTVPETTMDNVEKKANRISLSFNDLKRDPEVEVIETKNISNETVEKDAALETATVNESIESNVSKAQDVKKEPNVNTDEQKAPVIEPVPNEAMQIESIEKQPNSEVDKAEDKKDSSEKSKSSDEESFW